MAESEQSSPRLNPGAPAKVGFVYDDIFLAHNTLTPHPESPERLRAVLARLHQDGLYAQLTPIAPKPAAEKILAEIHAPAYIAEVSERCALSPGFLDAGDTFISTSSYAAARMAAGAVLEAVEAVMEGKVSRAFCAVRPPGHHAGRNRAMGFCIFNNIAVAARYLQKKHGVKRVLIVDWDVHHGNGTQDAFYDDPTVLYFSVHRHPFYPGTGTQDEQGSGRGKGFTVNVPLPAGSGDREYINAFKEQLLPSANRFRPDFVLVSAGFDAHADDPLGGMKVSTDCYGAMTDIVVGIAEAHCRGRLVSVLEGGYDLSALAGSVAAHVRQLFAPASGDNESEEKDVQPSQSASADEARRKALTMRENLKRHTMELSARIGERNYVFHENLERAAAYLKNEFKNYGCEVEEQVYYLKDKPFRNIIAVKKGRDFPDKIIIVGAHYDSVTSSPGADDNASGVAGLLELARLFSGHSAGKTIKFIAFVNEEPPFFMSADMGSFRYALAAKGRGDKIEAMLCLESIGYYSDEKKSQKHPIGLGFFFPHKGNFIAVASNISSSPLLKKVVGEFKKVSSFPLEHLTAPVLFAPAIAFSDHWSFWKCGYRAVMITDTAFYRNPSYHTPEDTYEKLNYEYISEVINGLFYVILDLAA